jgi:hypothetical protein
MFRSLHSVYCLCVNVYCSTATGVSTQLRLNIYHTIYHIIPYNIVSYHTSYHVSYHIIPYHITSHHIISYHISYHIVPYHITSWVMSNFWEVQLFRLRVRRVQFANLQEFANNQCVCCVYLSVVTDTTNCFTATLINDFCSYELTA